MKNHILLIFTKLEKYIKENIINILHILIMSFKNYNNNNNNRLLSSEYKRPRKTVTDEYQNVEMIKEKLKNYVELDPEDVDEIPQGSHLRYISYNPAKKIELFRFGGTLVTCKDEYLVLSGKAKKTFSVQRYIRDKKGKVIYTTRFFKYRNKEDMFEEVLENTIDKSKEILTKQNNIIQKQQKEIEELRKMMKKLSNK